MNCPYCGHDDSKVIDSRDVSDGIRRRRQCLQCDLRFTTYERWQPASLLIIKKDGSRQDYDREKILTGIRKACEKRPLPSDNIERLVEDIEAEIFRNGKNEIASAAIGEMVMDGLKKLDHIAYIRFASVYRDFADITMMKEEIDTLANHDVRHLDNQLPLLPPDEALMILKNGRRTKR